MILVTPRSKSIAQNNCHITFYRNIMNGSGDCWDRHISDFLCTAFGHLLLCIFISKVRLKMWIQQMQPVPDSTQRPCLSLPNPRWAIFHAGGDRQQIAHILFHLPSFLPSLSLPSSFHYILLFSALQTPLIRWQPFFPPFMEVAL